MDAPTCGVMDFPLMRGTPPDLLIVQDKSGSMNMSPSGGGASKWQQMTVALNQSVSSTQSQINWGLVFFPSDNQCGAATTSDVPIAVNNATAIQNALANQQPGGATPTHDAMESAAAYLAGLGDTNPKFIVLATDGEPNCGAGSGFGGNDDANAEQSITDASNRGIHTFVIGISAGSAADAVLNQMAMNGGEPRPSGPPYYYSVTSQADFVSAINSIAGQIISCTFSLRMPPSRPDLVVVTVSGRTVPRDPSHANGWDFGANNLSITFYGGACTTLQSGSATDVHAIFGCPPIGVKEPESDPNATPDQTAR
jgi:hypothetical protein